MIVFGSLGRGNWDEYSDLDLDVIVADDIRIDISNELKRLCKSFAGLNERAAIILPDGDEGDIIMELLMQLSIRYHPLSQTSPNIVDSMLVLAGSLDHTEIPLRGMELLGRRKAIKPVVGQMRALCSGSKRGTSTKTFLGSERDFASCAYPDHGYLRLHAQRISGVPVL